MTSIEAQLFLKQEFPDVQTWNCWLLGCYKLGYAMGMLMPIADQPSGKIAGWTWQHLPTSYPVVHYTSGGDDESPGSESRWTGAVRIQGPDSESFILFAFLDTQGENGMRYMVSTRDSATLERFRQDMLAVSEASDHIIIRSSGANSDIQLKPDSIQKPILDPATYQDIVTQTQRFFTGRNLHARLGIPYRRGFLFVGSPGNGKTLMTRHLTKLCAESLPGIAFWTLDASRRTADDDVDRLFRHASRQSPAMIILEDIDSLVTQTQVTRSRFLAQLDGLSPAEGVLIVASTNNPGDLDPALLHRPSRFDRVWHFRLPDRMLRTAYFRDVLPHLDPVRHDELAGMTQEWSFAYLNELRVTAAGQAVARHEDITTWEDLHAAHRLLAAQFQHGSKGYPTESLRRSGFAA